MKRRVAAATAAGLLALAAPREAHADDDTAGIVAVIALGASLVASDITFTAYTGGKVGRHEEPAESWMIAQSVVAGAQTVTLSGLSVFVAVEDDDEEGLALLPLLPGIWTGALTVFSTWSLGAPGETRVDTRLGLSFVAATNLMFSSAAIGSLAGKNGYTPYYISIPELTLMAPQAVLTAVQAARDESGRPGWAVLSAWSGVLTVHAVAALVTKSQDDGNSFIPPPEPVMPQPTPSGPSDPYYIDPLRPDLPQEVPTAPQSRPAPRPVVIPSPIASSDGVAPGLMMVGLF
ncbi:MAG: hypothetical protein IPM79_33215 [Polyangiaceae bacterium]|nr:hypothetical protein [Polyangiaceae bacterium]